jgi:hypothetical protein
MTSPEAMGEAHRGIAMSTPSDMSEAHGEARENALLWCSIEAYAHGERRVKMYARTVSKEA